MLAYFEAKALVEGQDLGAWSVALSDTFDESKRRDLVSALEQVLSETTNEDEDS